MNTKSLIRWREVRLKPLFAIGAAAAISAVAQISVQGASASELLEKGIYTEETKGELQAASQIYREIADDPGADRSLVAQAQLRLGLCELKLGNKPKAISALERLTREFPDKDKLLAVVGQQMPQLLDEMVKQIEQNYIQEVDRSELMETAIRAIIGKLDAGKGILRANDLEFLGAKETVEMNASIKQKIVGVGVALKLDEDSGEVLVTAVLPNSPALKGGIRPGDRIIEVDGEALPDGGILEEAVKRIRGTPGSSVTLGLKRAGTDERVSLPLVRAAVRLPSVKGDQSKADHTWEFMLDEAARIGYVRLTEVGMHSAREMEAALAELKGRGLAGLIVDLRNNPGGLLDQAVALSDLFVDSGRIVSVKGRTGEQVFDAKAEGTFTGFPIALLVNRNTASAAEILAACLQDHQRAIVVGERTYGQGIVRTIVPLKDNAGSLKIPIASYFRPNGKTMNRYPDAKETDDWGVTPDPGFEVPFSEEELQQWIQDRNARDSGIDSGAPAPQFQDRQLWKAREYIRERLGKN